MLAEIDFLIYGKYTYAMHLSWIFIGACMGWVTAYLAERRGRRWFPWFTIGFFFGLFGPFILYIFPSLLAKKSSPRASFVQPEPNTIEVEAVFVPRSTGWYYLDQQNAERGPLSLREIRRMWEENVLRELTFVWNETMPNWKRIGEIQDLFKYLKS